MQARFRQLWRLVRGRSRSGSPATAFGGSDRMAVSDVTGELALPDPERPMPEQPEQPVLLSPSGGSRPVHVGELLPARQRRWPLSMIRLPAIPRRAILAAGVCAGLAAPGLARHLVTRLVLGDRSVGRATRPEGIMEITRITYAGPLTPQATAAIGKALTAGRR